MWGAFATELSRSRMVQLLETEKAMRTGRAPHIEEPARVAKRKFGPCAPGQPSRHAPARRYKSAASGLRHGPHERARHIEIQSVTWIGTGIFSSDLRISRQRRRRASFFFRNLP
jgi:hypothetical protein